MVYEVISRCSFIIPEEQDDAELFRELNLKWKEIELGRFITFEKRDHLEIVFTEDFKYDN